MATNISIDDEIIKTAKNDKMKELVNTNYTYPESDDPNFQSKIYKKREFYYHKIPGRGELNDYSTIKEYRDKVCSGKLELQPHQSFLSNFINPDTPYRGLLIFHGTGSGKCLVGTEKVRVNDSLIEIQELWKRMVCVSIKDEEDGRWGLSKEPLFVDSLNTMTGEFVKRPVTRLFKQQVREYINIVTLENGTQIKLTKRHKLYTENGWSNDFITNKQIGVKDTNDELKFVPINTVTDVWFEGSVYDMEIDTFHNFVADSIICSNTCAAISIAEKFKDMVQKYNTKIYIVLPGPLLREQWKEELLNCTRDTYLKSVNKTKLMSEAESKKLEKAALSTALQYYKFMSYRSFYKKVLGDKIVEKVKTPDNKVKVSYRKNKEGEYERDVAIDMITNLDNSVIIIDEAHNLTGNARGEALLKLINNSKNLRIILLTATPMKNLADDVVELLNYIRPADQQIQRDRIFTSQKNHEMKLKPGGAEYLKKMAAGYVSYLRGADPITVAKRVEKGVVPNGLLFTKVTPCIMMKFQRETYDLVSGLEDDALDKRSEAVANFAFPGLNSDQDGIIGYYGIKGIGIIKNQIKVNGDYLNKKIASTVLKQYKIDDTSNLIKVSENDKTLTGDIMKMEYLKHFSTKFHKAMTKLQRLYWGHRGAKTAFIYSNLVRVGIELFEQVLLQNGYLEYKDDESYKINADTVCYFCGHPYSDHKNEELDIIKLADDDDDSDKQTIKNEKNEKVPKHVYKPATYITITGTTGDEVEEVIPEEKQTIVKYVFNNIENRNGKTIKFVLGSKVMGEGVSLKNIGEIHILDVYFNLGKVDQVMGRGIRYCSHYSTMTEKNPFPDVNVYKYVVSTPDTGTLTTEEDLYKKAEQKYMLIKKVERTLKEVAVDCPLNRNANIFPEDVVKYKNCIEPSDYKGTGELCPSFCEYTDCVYTCADPDLKKIYDPVKYTYKDLEKKELDYTTFTQGLARNEINSIKEYIKDLYRTKYVYTLREIIDQVKSVQDPNKLDLFDEFFVFKALDELIPITENDFNNFKDTLYDKFGRAGYLIYVGNYYIFQPFNQNEDVPMYYRSSYNKKMMNDLSLYNYLTNVDPKGVQDTTTDIVVNVNPKQYDFDSVMDYYDKRNEFKYVGIIDKESTRRKNKDADELADVFKIREKRGKVLDKKRGTGIPTIKGAVCHTSKSREYLADVAKLLKVKLPSSSGKHGIGSKEDITREDLCQTILNKMLFMEKYSTGSEKMTYVMIPANHKLYPFPYNLEDRRDSILNKIKEEIKFPVDITVKPIKTTVDGTSVTTYNIIIKYTDAVKEFEQFFKELGGVIKKQTIEIPIE